MCASNMGVHDVQQNLYAIANAYGASNTRIAVLPSVVFIQVQDESGNTHTEFWPVAKGGLRFDQLNALVRLTKDARAGAIPPEEGQSRIDSIFRLRPRFRHFRYLFGHILMTLGLGLILQPTAPALVFCLFFGALVGLLKFAGGYFGYLQVLLPTIASALVSSLVLLITRDQDVESVLRIVILPLVTFLPGAALTVGMEELVNGEVVSGASRLIQGLIQLLVLSFGMIAAVTVVGLAPSEVLVDEAANTIGWYAPWIGIAVFGVGVYTHLMGPMRYLPALLVTLYLTYGASQVGTRVLGYELNAFFGGFALIITVHLVEWLRGPPTLLTFVPGFWLLVPGAAGLIGVTELFVGVESQSRGSFGSIFLAILSIVLGMLVALALIESIQHAVRYWRLQLSGEAGAETGLTS